MSRALGAGGGDTVPEPTAPEPARAPAVVQVTPPAPLGCHPAYGGCLPILDGDAIDCANIPAEQWPVAIWDPEDDPYQLGDGQSYLACLPAPEAHTPREGAAATTGPPAPEAPEPAPPAGPRPGQRDASRS